VLNQIKQLVPASAIEAELAAKSVAAGEFQLGCMRQARQLVQRNPSRHDELLAQAARMGREARGHLASLLRVQAARVKRETTRQGAFQCDAIEECAGNAMLDALEHPPGGPSASRVPAEAPPQPSPAAPQPEPTPQPDAAAAAVAPPPSEPAVTMAAEPAPSPPPTQRRQPPRVPPEPAPPRHHAPAQNEDDDGPERDWAALAERYAIRHPQQAKLIRQLGGLPKQCDFGPPEPELLRAIVCGVTPELVALDRAA